MMGGDGSWPQPIISVLAESRRSFTLCLRADVAKIEHQTKIEFERRPVNIMRQSQSGYPFFMILADDPWLYTIIQAAYALVRVEEVRVLSTGIKERQRPKALRHIYVQRQISSRYVQIFAVQFAHERTPAQVERHSIRMQQAVFLIRPIRQLCVPRPLLSTDAFMG